MNKDYVRTSVVAGYIDGLLAEKRSLGYSYVFEEYLLNVFDHYCTGKCLKNADFDRKFLDGWLCAREGESSSYHSQRISFVRQLALYMNSLGIHAYIPVETVRKETIVSGGELRETQTADYFSSLCPIDCTVPSLNA